MNFYSVYTLLFSIFCLNNGPFNEEDTKNPVIGYQYNLWGIKADRLSGDDELLYTGRIFLDVRKEFKSSYDKDEHWFFSKEVIRDGEVVKLQGSDKSTIELKHDMTSDYYVTLKMGNKWSRFYYQDILNQEKNEVGKDVGCEECNFSEQIYLPEQDWIITLYFEIKPHYKFPKVDTEEDKEETQSLIAEVSTETDPATEAIIKIAESKETIATDASSPETTEKEEEVIVLSTHRLPEITSSINDKGEIQKVTFNPTRYYPKSEVKEDKYKDAPIVSIPANVEKSYHILFRIMPTPYERFDDLKHLGTLYRETYKENGKTRYMVGDASTIEYARSIAKELQNLGYRNLFIAEYQNGNLQKYVERIQS